MHVLSQNTQIPNSIKYYDENAQNYFETTVEYDISSLYDLFLTHIPKGAKILDGGCGSGRDSKFFLNQEYDVTAFDGSFHMVELARQLTGLTVAHKTFSEVNDEEEFEGIWTSASLLHVPQIQLPSILQKLKKALKPQGVWFLSFRYGEEEQVEGGRYFNDQTEVTLKEALEHLGGLTILHMNVPEELRSRRGYKFVACVVKKTEKQT